MSVTIIVGGQFGSEAKGKVSLHLARSQAGPTLVFRPGGTNSGHIGTDDAGLQIAFRQLPAAILDPRVRAALPAGSYIDVDLLLKEIERAGLPADTTRLIIHPDASLITEAHKASEVELTKMIGSTGSGTGAAVRARIAGTMTGDIPPLARDEPRLAPWLGDTADALEDALAADIPVIVEGTQGSGLSLTHSGTWPKCTSRDTNAAGLAAECGIAPTLITRIMLICRAHPIRVAGPSGDLPGEIDWAQVSRTAGRPIEEVTTVTQKVRRVARFDPEVVRRAIAINKPTDVVLNHLDYVDGSPDITPAKMAYVQDVESLIGRRIDWLGVDPERIIKKPE